MKLNCLIISLCFTGFQLLKASDLTGQELDEVEVVLELRNESLKAAFSRIEKQTYFRFAYNKQQVENYRNITVPKASYTLRKALDLLLENTHLVYRLSNSNIIIFKQDEKENSVKADVPAALIQDLIITGTVTNNRGEPVEGATVTEKEQVNSTSTDAKGFFRLKVKSNSSVLVITNIGYETQEISVGAVRSFNLVLKPGVSSDLNDIVVVGYGTQKKATNTGSQSSMSGKLLVQSPAANISNSLVGRLPGLFASQASGEPGNDQSTLRIRGVGTFNGSQEPLILVDGIQVSNYNNIDPNEIENVTILKDASATAVYGIRGANGVLIITTKRGKEGPARVSYTFNNAINSFTALRSQMNSYDWTRSFNEARRLDAYTLQGPGAVVTPTYSDAAIEKYRTGEDPIFFPNTNWYDVMLKKTSSQQQHNLNVSGGTDKVRYAISAGYFNQEGLFNNTDLADGYDGNIRFKRYNFRSNLNFDITKRFRAALDMASQTEQRSGNAGVTANVIENIARANPTVSPGLVDGKLINLSAVGGNPIGSLYQAGFQQEYRNYLNGSVRLDHDLDFITPGLTTHGIISYQNFNRQRFLNRKGSFTIINYIPQRMADSTVVFLPQNPDEQFQFSQTTGKNRRTTTEFAFDYRRKFGDHNVSGLLLYNQQKSIDPLYTFLVPAGYQSYVGRATYDYRGKYLAELSVAYNGTENFAPGNRFGVFPAYSVGWVASEEKFFPETDFINFLKIRASYGEVGNDQIGSLFLESDNRFLFRPTAWTQTGGSRFGEVATGYNLLPGYREGRASNPDLTWERAIKSNLGVEMSFWNKKISMSVDIFKETRDNILANRQTVSGIIGIGVPPENLGKMQNRGYEIDLTLNHDIGEFNFQVKANYSFARNKILFQDEVPPLFAYQARTGQRFGQIFGLRDLGLLNTWEEVNDPKRVPTQWDNNRLQPGDISFEDVNGDGLIDGFDQVPIGYSNIPEKTYGFSLVGQYKGFSFSVLFQGTGNVSLGYTRRFISGFFDTPAAGAVDYLLNSWSQERYDAGLPIQFPRLSLGVNGGLLNNYQSSTFFLADASYLRLKNVEIGYTFSGSTLKKIGLSSARIFANANNLYTWSKVYPGVDPESPPTATNTEPYPLVRTINTGININF